MAVSPQGNGVSDPSQAKLMADINVTPMVDVMLVLLVIFMVTAPLLVAGMPVELPRTAAPPIAQPQKPVVVTLGAGGSLSIRDEHIEAEALVPRLAAIRAEQGDATVYVRADKKISYGEVMELLGRISSSGYQRISLLSQPPSPDASAAPQAAIPTVPEAK
jgi:biopolymer transport protein ExbD